MAAVADDIRKQVNDLWSQALAQLEEVRGVLSGKLQDDMVRLRRERERLAQRLGEETFRLIRQGRLYVPEAMQGTVDRLNTVVERLLKTQRKAGATKKKSTRARKSRAKRPTRAVH